MTWSSTPAGKPGGSNMPVPVSLRRQRLVLRVLPRFPEDESLDWDELERAQEDYFPGYEEAFAEA